VKSNECPVYLTFIVCLRWLPKSREWEWIASALFSCKVPTWLTSQLLLHQYSGILLKELVLLRKLDCYLFTDYWHFRKSYVVFFGNFTTVKPSKDLGWQDILGVPRSWPFYWSNRKRVMCLSGVIMHSGNVGRIREKRNTKQSLIFGDIF
jgi:hypothetical protein